ncbi:hypothetical protein C2E23DRAFT_387093 [Lenzites betulinus]|nr:hypothetical protein C2E23DRAFT_387093 [Lenzites betulinus]
MPVHYPLRAVRRAATLHNYRSGSTFAPSSLLELLQPEHARGGRDTSTAHKSQSRPAPGSPNTCCLTALRHGREHQLAKYSLTSWLLVRVATLALVMIHLPPASQLTPLASDANTALEYSRLTSQVHFGDTLKSSCSWPQLTADDRVNAPHIRRPGRKGVCRGRCCDPTTSMPGEPGLRGVMEWAQQTVADAVGNRCTAKHGKDILGDHGQGNYSRIYADIHTSRHERCMKVLLHQDHVTTTVSNTTSQCQGSRTLHVYACDK